MLHVFHKVKLFSNSFKRILQFKRKICGILQATSMYFKLCSLIESYFIYSRLKITANYHSR